MVHLQRVFLSENGSASDAGTFFLDTIAFVDENVPRGTFNNIVQGCAVCPQIIVLVLVVA